MPKFPNRQFSTGLSFSLKLASKIHVAFRNWYNTIMAKVLRDKGLVKVFKRYHERYLAGGRKPNVKKLFANDLYHTTRLEGEKITKKEARALFR